MCIIIIIIIIVVIVIIVVTLKRYQLTNQLISFIQLQISRWRMNHRNGRYL